MEEKLKELKRKKEQISDELDSINKEIKKIEDGILGSNQELYEGKWFFKRDYWWDDLEFEDNRYEIVYIRTVYFRYGRPLLSVVKFAFDHYYVLRDVNIEVEDEFSVDSLKDMKEMTEYEFAQMDETFKQLIKYLFKIRPLLKGKIETD